MIYPATQVKRRGQPSIAGGYRSSLAQQRADIQVSKARNSKRLIVGNKLWNIMMPLLHDFHSPEQISGILKPMNPDDISLKISHESIYTAIYAMPRGALRSERSVDHVVEAKVVGEA